MSELLRFTDDGATDAARVGGKGANLGVLTAAGFSVPPGFVVGATAYVTFLCETGLESEIRSRLLELDGVDAERLEVLTAEIRATVEQREIPAGLAGEIVAAYGSLGADSFVAVRSSATKEDSADASFAGLHDTFLDVRGPDEVLLAVRRCWASLWTARAVSYRQTKGVDHFESPIAVVVQQMVRSEVSGVMYTGHPVTTATDEIVVNASYGLGEAIVSSAVDPDTFVLKAANLTVKERTPGAKEIRIVRATGDARGTVSEPVPEPERARYSLTDEQLAELGRLGRRVQAHYGGFPQDIEWAYADGAFYLVQTRPLTGVEFSWDADVDEGLWSTPDDDDFVWTRDMADENWTGAISPLMYSFRAPAWVAGHQNAANQWGHREIANTRFFKFYKGEAYYNSKVEKLILERTVPPQLRPFHPSGFAKLPPEWREETMAAPFSWWALAKQYARVEMLQPQLIKGFETWDWYMYSEESLTRAHGLPDENLSDLDDRALIDYIDGQIQFEFEYLIDLWTIFFINARDAFLLLSYLVVNWYDGDAQEALGGLLTGVSRKTKTLEANHDLWLMSQMIANSPELVQAFKEHEGAAFFTAARACQGGEELLAKYATFIRDYGHRGHADRDIIYARRAEDPGLDYNALKPMLSGVLDTGVGGNRIEDPEAREAAVSAHREQVTEQVLAAIRRKPFGSLRADLFMLVLNYCHRFVLVRDDERHFIDIITYSIRRGYLEMNRRLVERGTADSDRDVFFLSRRELYEWFEGRAAQALMKAKIAARMRDFDSFLNRTRIPPPYLHRGHEMDFEVVEHEGSTLKGLGTARGKVKGTARIANGLYEIGRIKHGDIMVVNATDPGWTTVFSVISGIVLETGGMTAHGAMLAREYGLPAVQLANATRLIEDGVEIEIDGDVGLVILPDANGDGAGAQLDAEPESGESNAALTTA